MIQRPRFNGLDKIEKPIDNIKMDSCCWLNIFLFILLVALAYWYARWSESWRYQVFDTKAQWSEIEIAAKRDKTVTMFTA